MCYHFAVSLVVIDTSVYVAALLGPSGANREALRKCLTGEWRPLMGSALYFEYEDVLSRGALFADCPITAHEREELFDAFLRTCLWTRVYFAWRPNLPDEGDNHVVELAVAGGATRIVTRNVRDFAGAELRFPGLRAVRPEDLIEGR
jgi:predicted nucleic acid-binding protein